MDDRVTKPRAPEVIIKEDIVTEKKKPDPTPDPGKYDSHLTPFGADLKNTATMGNKYKFVPKEGPPPGLYEPNESAIKPRAQSAVIKEETHPYRRPQ